MLFILYVDVQDTVFVPGDPVIKELCALELSVNAVAGLL